MIVEVQFVTQQILNRAETLYKSDKTFECTLNQFNTPGTNDGSTIITNVDIVQESIVQPQKKNIF